nr:hypothetical protein [uncultured Desulfobulbus sp.]
MNIIINIGKLNNDGGFDKNRWIVLLGCLAEICNNIRLYTKFHRNQIDDFFSNGWRIEEEPFPDVNADLRGFRLWGNGLSLWTILQNLYFDPDKGVTHIYFLNNDKYIAELEVEDGENFIILHLTNSQEQELLKIIPNLSENVEICATWYEFLNDISGDDTWKPLGVSEGRDLV